MNSIHEKPERKVQFVCLSGLPRTGSTLLSAILSQNPKIHAEGNSAVCQIMWDTYISCTVASKERIIANNRAQTIMDILSSIPGIYYKNIDKEVNVVVDKCRSWTVDANFELGKKFIDPNIKIIVLERSILEIIKSFVKIFNRNNKYFNPLPMLQPKSDPIMRSISGIQWAKKNNQNNNFLFINYEELIQ